MTTAMVLKRICVGAEPVTETVTYEIVQNVLTEEGEHVLDEIGQPLTETVTMTEDRTYEQPLYANPGEVISVDDWSDIDSYISTGTIQLIPSTQAVNKAMKLEQAKLDAAREALEAERAAFEAEKEAILNPAPAEPEVADETPVEDAPIEDQTEEVAPEVAPEADPAVEPATEDPASDAPVAQETVSDAVTADTAEPAPEAVSGDSAPTEEPAKATKSTRKSSK